MADDNIHAGHRSRLRARAVADPALTTFSDHEILELLLFYSIPRADTNAIAHRLISRFKTLRGVFEASPEELATVEGIGENSALLLSLIPAVTSKYLLSRQVKKVRLTKTESLGDALMPFFVGKRDETVYAMFLDKNCQSISCDLIGEGNLNAVSFNAEKIIRMALLKKAKYVVLAHNHVSGFANPSEQDMATTRRLRKMLGAAGIVLLDHLIIADPISEENKIGEYVSLAESGIFAGE